MKRPREEDSLSTLTYKSDLFSDVLTPPSDNKRFKDKLSALAPVSTQPSSTQQSLSSPPPSPLVSQLVTERPFRNRGSSTQESDDVDEYQLIEKPPYGLSPDKYHTAIRSNIQQHVRMTQLMLWSAHEAMKRNAKRVQSIEDRRADQIAASIQARLKQGLREGKIVTSWYTRLPGPGTVVDIKKAPNPRNEVNRRRIQDFKQVLKSLDEEDQEWRDTSNQLFADHAAMLDSSAKESIPTAVTVDMLDALNDNEKQFVDTYCQDDSETLVQERIDFEDMEAEVTDLRQKLSVVSHFQRGAERYCKETMSSIARAMERETCISSNRAKFEHIVNEDRAVREAKKETARSILQALSSLNSNSNKKP